MKEISIEEKARRYDEAKYIMKEYLESGNAGVIAENTIKKAFPELAESEDEKIRKEIISFLKSPFVNEYIADERVTPWIAWLEKQGENVHNEELSKLLNEVICHFINNPDIPYSKRDEVSKKIIPYVEKLEKQGEQKPADKIQLGKTYKCIASPRYSTFMIGKIYKPEDKFLCSLMNFCSDCFESIEGEKKTTDSYCQENCKGFQETGKCFADGECKAKRDTEQKPAWSEDDTQYINDTLALLSFGCSIHSVGEVQEWLQSLSNRVQLKQKWSEDDEEMFNEIILDLKALKNRDTGEAGKAAYQKEIDWLKSLRPQSQWKPSVEQMIAIETAINVLGKGTLNGKQLIELQEQLKKLKEE